MNNPYGDLTDDFFDMYESSEKADPKAARILGAIIVIVLVMVVACSIIYYLVS